MAKKTAKKIFKHSTRDAIICGSLKLVLVGCKLVVGATERALLALHQHKR